MNYYVLHKPYGYLSQFTPEGKWKGLGELHPFPKDVYAVGRLDADSEGLLLLTNDKAINHQLLDPKFKHKRRYMVQVEGVPNENQLLPFSEGMVLNYKGKQFQTGPTVAHAVGEPEWLVDREPPIRMRKNKPTSWLELVLTEGKNRQVRKMTA
ncbi:MAG: pseudouridine synthase, partial [Flavobacteriales bacterium]